MPQSPSSDELTDDSFPLRPLALVQARARAWAALFEGKTRSGVRLGRYVLLDELGAGAMGLVYAAYDPELDRKVAVKVLRGLPVERDRGDAARLVREARALARLSHPNVVAVYDVGLVEPEGTTLGAGTTVFIAMEYVRGTTLRHWLAEAPRPWREVKEMLAQAGRGLAAAHDVGLVHRDFKPDNVMVGEDGRARVMDFGLARLPEQQSSSDEGELPSATPLELDRTHTGAVAGTPAYMAPEQHRAGSVGAHSDQFAFCVAAWEAFVGRRPFAERSDAAPTEALARPPEGPRPGDRAPPAWVLAALRRGLASDPAARYPDMHALLTALADDPARRRRRWLGLAAVLAVLAVGTGGMAWVRQQRERSCRAAAASIEEVWSDADRAGIATAIEATALPYAADTRQRVVEGLDSYVQRWATSRAASCRAHLVEGRVDPGRAARTEACLDESRDALASWIELVQTASPAEVASLTEATAELPPIDPCLDEVWLARRPMPADDVATRAQARARQRRLARARSLSRLHRHDEALREAEAVEAEAEADGMVRLQAQAALQAAASASGAGQFDAARAGRERALASALAVGDDGLVIEALAELTTADAADGRHERARAWLAVARPLLRRVEPQPGLLTTAVLDAAGVAAFMEGADREAMEQHQQALEIAQRILPAAHPWLTRSLNNLASVQQRQGDFAGAVATVERVVDARTRALGPGHPLTATALANLGSAYGSAGRLEEAEATLERALPLTEQAYGSEHARVGTLLVNLGVTRVHRGRVREAVDVLERAPIILERAHGPEHPQVARAVSALGMALLHLGNHARAVELLQRALGLFERLHGAEHPSVAVTLGTLGGALLALGRLDEAEAAQRRALAIREQTLPAEHVDIASSHLELAAVLTQQGKGDEAVNEAGWALAVYEGPGGDPRNAVLSQLGLGHALVAAGRLDEALEHYERSRDGAEALDRDDLRSLAFAGIATVHERRGRWEEALEGFERAHGLAERTLAPDDPGLASTLVGLAVALRALGRLERARGHAERALALRTAASEPSWRVAEVELVLAEILVADPGQRARARLLRQRACAVPPSARVQRLDRCESEPGAARLDVVRSR
jgi:eukaryotic-like serine/threonine-protein kinase